MQTIHLLADRAAFLRCARAALAPGGLLAVALLGEGVEPFELELAPDAVAARRRALRERADGAARLRQRRRAATSLIERRRSRIARRRGRARSSTAIEPARAATRATLAGEARAARLRSSRARRSDRADARARRQRDRLPGGGRDDAARLRALPGPDEHLRRPRQPADARAPLRVAGDRVAAARAAALGETLARRARPLLHRRRPGRRPAPLRRAISSSARRTRCARAAARGAVVLGVCGGYQLLGHSYELGEETIAGIGLLDVRTVRGDGPRLIGNVAVRQRGGRDRRLREPRRAHAARPPARQPLGRVLRGHGNDGRSGSRGRAHRQRDRHLRPRAAAAEERLAVRLADRARARRRARRARAARRLAGGRRARERARAAGVG